MTIYARRVILASGLSAAIAITALSSGASALGLPFAPKPSAPLVKKLNWTTCRTDETLLCATLAVPVDRAAPNGYKINLAVQKRPVGKGVKKLGTLLTGSGFPGNPGNEAMAEDVRSPQFNKPWVHYDVIGYEHRGTGRSTPLICATSANELGFGPFVADDKLDEVLAAWVKDCANRNPLLSAHMSAADSAGDIESLRVALGEAQLSFQLWNHDAMVGAAYNALYPGRVKNMALIDPYPLTGSTRYLLDQAQSDEARLAKFAQNCAAASACALNATPGPYGRLDALLAKVTAKPVPLTTDPEDGAIGPREVMSLAVNLLPDESNWSSLAASLADLEKGNIKNLDLDKINFSSSRYFLSDTGAAFWAIACQDGLFARNVNDWETFVSTLAAESPHTRYAYIASSGGCIDWPIASAPPVNVAPRIKTPVLVISRAERLGLPNQWATTAAANLGGRAYVTTGTWDACITQTLAEFFERGVLPAPDARCS